MMTRQKLLQRPHSGKSGLPTFTHVSSVYPLQSARELQHKSGPTPSQSSRLNEPILTAPLMPSSPLLDVSTTHRPNSPLKV